MRFPDHTSLEELPRWMTRHPRGEYLAAKWYGRPRDPEDRARVRALEWKAYEMRKLGHDVVVDHIEPLRSDWVCGLHHSANLRIIDRRANARKSNGQDHPELDMPLLPPHQMRLL